jgi:hypothetical protein
MRRLFSICAVLIFLVLPALAQGTATATRTSFPDQTGQTTVHIVTFAWSGVNATGSTSTIVTTPILGWYLTRAETIPVGDPTPLYNIAINTASGADLMGGNLQIRSQTLAEIAFPPTTSPVVDSAISLVITDQNNASASGTVKLYFGRVPSSGTASLTGTVTIGNLRDDETADTPAGNTGVPLAAYYALATNSPVHVGDSVRIKGEADGSLLVRSSCPFGDAWEYYAVTVDNSEVTIKAGEVGYYLYITQWSVQNSSATVPSTWTFKEATGGTARDGCYAGVSGGGMSKGNGGAAVASTQTSGNGFFGVAGTTNASLLVHARGCRTQIKPVY